MATARLNATITDDGALPCEVRFQYGKTIALGTYTPWIGGWLMTGDSISQVITGLAGNTIYYFRAEVRNAMGVGTPGAILFFITTTHAIAAVDILPPTHVTANSARLHGLVVYDGDRRGSVRFHYGTTTDYGMFTAWQFGFGTGDEFQADIYGLSPETAYHCRAEFMSSPSVFSKDLSFSTLGELGGMVLVEYELTHLLEESV